MWYNSVLSGSCKPAQILPVLSSIRSDSYSSFVSQMHLLLLLAGWGEQSSGVNPPDPSLWGITANHPPGCSLASSSHHPQAGSSVSASPICMLWLPPRPVLISSLVPWLMVPLQIFIYILLRFLIVPVLSFSQVRQCICIHFHGYDGFDVRKGSLQSVFFSN